MSGECIHKLQPLGEEDASMLFVKLLGADGARACGIDKARAQSMVMRLNGNPRRILEVPRSQRALWC